MKSVVDTNILFSFFWKNSLTRKLIVSSRFDLVSPEFALAELENYKRDITRRAKIGEMDFSKTIEELKKTVKFVNQKEYSAFVTEAERISPDKGDVDFLALCLKENCFLWSNDELLKKQDIIRVLSTEEIIRIFFG